MIRERDIEFTDIYNFLALLGGEKTHAQVRVKLLEADVLQLSLQLGPLHEEKKKFAKI